MFVATAFICVLVYGTYVFFLSRAQSHQDVFKLVPAFVVFGLLLLLTALFSLSEYLSLKRTLDATPVDSLAMYRNYEADHIVLIGYAANGKGDAITLADGELDLVGEDVYKLIGDEWEMLTIGERMVVVGSVVESDVVTEVLYAGTYDKYRAFLWRRLVIPALTTVLSFILGVMVLILPFAYLRRGRVNE